jgi:DNA-binding NtrC family response regulator
LEENIQRIIHSSHRKHGKYIAKLWTIPEGTIDSELFGHEKALLLEQQALVKVILKWLTAERFSR